MTLRFEVHRLARRSNMQGRAFEFNAGNTSPQGQDLVCLVLAGDVSTSVT